VTFTWDPAKAGANLKKHEVNFREAATVFDDPWSVAFPDSDHSWGERRFVIIGMSAGGRILVVAYTEVNANLIRIISARVATSHERRFYEEDTTQDR
jgi:uncharacterized DUF497 family protein